MAYLDLADGYLRYWERPLVIVVGGLSGTGKTTLATELARGLGAELLRTDSVRQEIYGAENQPAAIDAGVYRPAARQRVYDELLIQSAAVHRERVPVILDGTFASASLFARPGRSLNIRGAVFLQSNAFAHGRCDQANPPPIIRTYRRVSGTDRRIRTTATATGNRGPATSPSAGLIRTSPCMCRLLKWLPRSFLF